MPRPSLLELVRDALEGRYDMEGPIGHGGAARVFRARDAEGRTVAVKVLHPQLALSVTADRFLREVELLSRLDHPRISRIRDSGQSDWLIYYVMDFVEGQTLRAHMDDAGRMPLDETIQVGVELLDALGYAHAHGIVHRDVKPENIVLSGQGATLLDFGIAKAIADAGMTRLTRSGFTVGTSTYMSPEQIQGALDIDNRSDLYAVGCVLYECLAGRPPFVSPREEHVLHLHQTQSAAELRTLRSDVPASVEEAIARAMEKERDARWGTAAAMQAALGGTSPHTASGG